MVERGREDRKRIRMRTYRNLWLDFISDQNIKLAIKNFSKGKKKRNKIKKILADVDAYVPKIREYAINFTPFEHKAVEIYDGISRKKRKIVIPSVMESILHHMIINVLKPMFIKGTYEHSYGSVPGRGGLYGKKCICKWIRKGGRNIKYCLKLDIRHFYESISQDILIKKLKAKIKDFRFVRIVENVIRCVPSGLPLGFYTSVWLANWYLEKLDHAIKSLGVKLYFARYVDDMVIFGSSKKFLRTVVKETIKKYLEIHGLTIKRDWQIFRFHYFNRNQQPNRKGNSIIYGRFVDFMGYKFFRNKTTLRKSILRKIRSTALRLWRKEHITSYDAKQILSSLGWLKSCDIYNYYLKHIKPFVNFKKLKNKVSKADRKAREHNDGLQNSRIYAVGQAI